MSKLVFSFVILFGLSVVSSGQEVNLSYYLPDIEYDAGIPKPEQYIGHSVGEWHVTHDKLYFYARELARLSDRITLTEYARSHEDRPLVYLTITSPDNHSRLETIRLEHKKLTDTESSESVDIESMPIVIYQGCSIHGNEPSGANGALATMYYLAAGQGDQIDRLLREAVILFDPSYNPDGLQRFSTWVNTHKGKNLITDPISREFNEAWPRGRTNHYWFDLNRDWLLLTHPESRGRIRTFQSWKPDILTDHHEMGSNSTFFFQPGIPSRTNPNTPALNQELTAKIGEYHGKALDKIGSLYYAKESFDDFYYGKGSTYPDAQGCIGILFEQGSSRGHLQKTDHGLLSFPFTIRNQVATMLSTQEAGINLRKEILEYKRQSFLEARQLARSNPVKAFVFGESQDPYRVARFLEILTSHEIEVYNLSRDFAAGHHKYRGGQDYIVPLDQNQYRLAKSIFEKMTSFTDSLFYDVSAWTLPLAFNLDYDELRSDPSAYTGSRVQDIPWPKGVLHKSSTPYAYLVEWHQYLAPRALYEMLEKDLIVKLANEAFSMRINNEDKHFKRGTLIVPTGNNQALTREDLDKYMNSLAEKHQLAIHAVNTGLVSSGINLGSRSTDALEKIKPIMVIGDGVSSYNAGELWHHFDQILHMPVTMVDANQFSRVNLSNYNVLILPDGSYGRLNSQKEKIKSWIQSGGNVIAIQGAIRWLRGQEIIKVDQVNGENEKQETKMKPYARANEDRGAKVTGGMIAMTELDITHPLFYGYYKDHLPVFRRGNDYYKPVANPYKTPARYTEKPLLSGYLHAENEAKMKGAAAVFTINVGRGRVISLVDNPVFRGYWWGSSHLLANALFFGQSIN